VANYYFEAASTPLPYSVVVKNPPKSFETPIARKDFILSTCGKLSDDIVELKRNKDEWKVMVKSKDSAEKIANTMKIGNISRSYKFRNNTKYQEHLNTDFLWSADSSQV
jgi:hypothetical protein